MATPTTYQLACELQGHEEDVRGICVIDDATIATSSRDKTVKLWRRDPNQPPRQQQQQDGGGFAVDKTFVGHTGFVGPVVRLPPSDEQHPLGALVSGGMDAKVVVWDVAKGEAEMELVGHGGQVTGLTVTPTGDVVSTSVDKTVRMWHCSKCSEVLEGHESSVLCALALPNGDIVSGSGDCTLKWWRGGVCVRTVKAHSDTVRGVAEMPGVGLLSASHDGSVKLWDAEGGLLLEMVGHTALVYSVAASAAADSQGGIGLVASGSEDGTARVWRNGECVQALEHPGCVWAVAFLPNGDLVTACGDGVARVWTMSVDRVAAADVREGYDALIKAQRKSRTVGGVKVEDLPGPEALQEPGRKNGQTRIVREGDVGVAYSWNAKEYNWDKIGEVVDGPSEPTESRTINGVTYDYVFDVDIGDGVPVRKLPYNHGQNPYEVADRWLLEQDLPLSYREQVVGFILQNTGTGGGGGGGGAASASPFGNTIPDPYTGGQAYVPGAPPPGRGPAGAVGAPASAPAAAQPSFPKKGMLVFDTAQYDGILKKLREFNASLQGDASTAALSLGAGNMARMEAVVATLKDTSHYHSSTFAPADVALVSRLLSAWPAAILFPVLDVLRLMLLHPSAASLISADINSSSSSGGADVLLGAIRRAGAGEPPVTANQLTGLRVAVNVFRHLTHFKSWLLQHRMEIVDMFAGCASSTNKNVKLAFATLLLNFSVLLVDSKDEDGQIQVLSAAFEAAGASSDVDSTARQRALLAIATLMHSGMVRQVALDLDAAGVIAGACSSADTTVAALGREMQTLLR